MSPVAGGLTLSKVGPTVRLNEKKKKFTSKS